MSPSALDPFAFDFNSVSVGDNAIDTFPFDVPLMAVINGVEYKNLAPKAAREAGEVKTRLVISQTVYNGEVQAEYDTLISPQQGYLLKGYMQAVGIEANELSNQPLDEEGLQGTFIGKQLLITFQEREYQGKKYRNVSKTAPLGDSGLPF